VTEDLGGKEVFTCQWPTCAHTVHRDLNGATGIFVRRLALTVAPSRHGKLATTVQPAFTR
jgi:hypothetical protein